MRCLCLAAIVAAALLVIAVGEDYYYYQDEASEDGDVYYYYEDEELAPTHMQQPVDVQASGWTEGHLEDRTEVQLEEDVAYLYSDEEEMDMHGEAFTFGDTAESSASDEADPLPPKYGFKKSGSGLKRMSAPMVSAAFLDDMATQFGCLLSKNSGPQRVQDPSYRPPPKEPVDKNKQTAKKLTAKEVEAARAKAREEEERKFKTMHPLGADCETQVCGACRSVVEVFVTAVHAAIRDPRYQFVYDVAEGFCERSVGAKYSPLMIHVCSVMLDEDKGYREGLVWPFEQDESIDQVASPESKFAKAKHVCLALGACSLSQYDLITEPEERAQEQWELPCFVCQAVVRSIEERLSLVRILTDDAASFLVSDTCTRMGLIGEPKQICTQLVSGPRVDDIAWMAKVHMEAMTRKELGAEKFADKVCEDVVMNDESGSKFCEKWVDPAELRRKAIEDSIEPVFY